VSATEHPKPPNRFWFPRPIRPHHYRQGIHIDGAQTGQEWSSIRIHNGVDEPKCKARIGGHLNPFKHIERERAGKGIEFRAEALTYACYSVDGVRFTGRAFEQERCNVPGVTSKVRDIKQVLEVSQSRSRR
jgi:hypothetical protein